MPLNSQVETVEGRGATSEDVTNGFEDISGGAVIDTRAPTGDGSTTTIYLEVKGAIDLTVEVSPNGSDWFEPQQSSPVSFGSAGTDVILVEFDSAAVRLTGSNTTGTKIKRRTTA